jgi:adiponectin receptor
MRATADDVPPEVNVFSHLIGAAIFFVLPLVIYGKEIPPRYALATTADIVACLIYFLGVAICFLLSAMSENPPFPHPFSQHRAKIDMLSVEVSAQ